MKWEPTYDGLFYRNLGARRGMRRIAALGFAALYFLIYVASFTIHFLYQIGAHMTLYSYTLNWVLMHPNLALRMVFTELTRSPMTLSIVILCSIIMGFATDWALHNAIKMRK